MKRGAGHGGNADGKTATLYVVATPIGNLADVTLRALDVLKSADAIAAEDTRVTARLLDHYGITAKKLFGLHEHNEQRATPRLLADLAAGASIALVSDAGTPGISDPGARLIAAVHDAGYRVVPIPGPSAVAAAVSASGILDTQFLFYGFLPAKAGERRKALDALALLPFTLVFYEAPHRVLDSVGDLCGAFGGERRLVIARELTKLFESVHACLLSEAVEWLEADPDRTRGELVLVVEGPPKAAGTPVVEASRTLKILLDELPVKQAASLAAKITGARKNELYALALTLKARDDGC